MGSSFPRPFQDAQRGEGHPSVVRQVREIVADGQHNLLQVRGHPAVRVAAEAGVVWLLCVGVRGAAVRGESVRAVLGFAAWLRSRQPGAASAEPRRRFTEQKKET